MSPQPIRLALVGAGLVTRVHVAAINRNPDLFTLAAICDPNAEARAMRVEEANGTPREFDDWQTMLAEMGDDIDAVTICLPHHLHVPAITDIANAGKHILCEKPLCLTLAEADALDAIVKQAGITFMVGHNFLFMAATVQARRWLDEGRIGEMYWIRTQELSARPADFIQGTWRAQPDVQGGGEYIDSGYHPTYILLHMVESEAEEVRAVMTRHRILMPAEDTAIITLRFANGVLGEVFNGWAYFPPVGSHPLHIIGGKGQIFGGGNTLHFQAEGSDEIETVELDGPGDWAETFVAEYTHFGDCVLGGKEPIPTLAESRRTLDVVLRAYADAPYATKLG